MRSTSPATACKPIGKTAQGSSKSALFAGHQCVPQQRYRIQRARSKQDCVSTPSKVSSGRGWAATNPILVYLALVLGAQAIHPGSFFFFAFRPNPRSAHTSDRTPLTKFLRRLHCLSAKTDDSHCGVIEAFGIFPALIQSVANQQLVKEKLAYKDFLTKPVRRRDLGVVVVVSSPRAQGRRLRFFEGSAFFFSGKLCTGNALTLLLAGRGGVGASLNVISAIQALFGSWPVFGLPVEWLRIDFRSERHTGLPFDRVGVFFSNATTRSTRAGGRRRSSSQAAAVALRQALAVIATGWEGNDLGSFLNPGNTALPLAVQGTQVVRQRLRDCGLQILPRNKRSQEDGRASRTFFILFYL
eukprot:GHVT01018497.1.p1 GENE.GHVT01018497.1~~GHVT01018497.1.p1  ORF type:complete len:356 (-),score=31.76 GHVT01018497.1:392-1459(-)